MKKFLFAIITAVIMGGVITFSVLAQDGLFQSKGCIESQGVVFNAKDFSVVSEAYEIGKEESYQSGYENGKQEIIDNLPAYMSDYFSGKTLTMTGCNFHRSSGVTFPQGYTFPKDGFWIGKWFFRDTDDYKKTTTHRIDILLYNKDGELKQKLWEAYCTTQSIQTSMMLIPVQTGDYIVMNDYDSPKYVYYAFESWDGQFLSFD